MDDNPILLALAQCLDAHPNTLPPVKLEGNTYSLDIIYINQRLQITSKSLEEILVKYAQFTEQVWNDVKNEGIKLPEPL